MQMFKFIEFDQIHYGMVKETIFNGSIAIIVDDTNRELTLHTFSNCTQNILIPNEDMLIMRKQAQNLGPSSLINPIQGLILN